MKLGYGLVSAQLGPGADPSWTGVYDSILELAEVADRAGLASLWTTEHHFVDDGYMPSLLTVMAAMAARTTDITLGTGVVLAPLHHPLRLAEDAATLAVLSHDRLVLGLGLGWSETEFEAFGVPRHRRGAAMDEIIPILRQAWTGDPIHHTGELYRFPPVGVRPVPDRPIPIWVGGNADAALRRIGRLADGFFGNASPARLAEQVAVIQEERARHDITHPFTWGYYHYVWITDRPDADRELVLDHVWHTMWKYGDMEPSARRPLGPPPAPPAPSSEQRERVERVAAIGSAEQVAERLRDVADSVPVDLHLVARAHFPAMEHGSQVEQVERLASELMPLLV